MTYKHRGLKTKDLCVFDLDPTWTLSWTLLSTLVIHVVLRARANASAFRKPVQNMLLREDFKISI